MQEATGGKIRSWVDSLAAHEGAMTERERHLCTTLLHGLAASGRLSVGENRSECEPSDEGRAERTADLVYLVDNIRGVEGFLVGWISGELTLAQLEQLVDTINSVYRRHGQPLLPRPDGDDENQER